MLAIASWSAAGETRNKPLYCRPSSRMRNIAKATLLLVRQAFVRVEAEQSRPQDHHEYEGRNEDDAHRSTVAFIALYALGHQLITFYA
jgi:hypothetical protein